MWGFLFGVLGTTAVALFMPVTFQKFVAYVRGFWDKTIEENTEVK